jgi:hypothetical protein
MDRNLGASQVAISSTDALSYGDLYQWGRGADGHQISTSSLTAGQSSSTTPGSSFLTGSPNWYSGTNPDNLWQGVSGNVNNPCPSGYRLPTEAEWDAERLSWVSQNQVGALASSLKLPVAGFRDGTIASLVNVSSVGYYWSSTVFAGYSRHLGLDINVAAVYPANRSDAFSVRCIKD